ncbi:MAG: gluconate:H+ symporter [Flavobacteriaceae bacterium]
MELSLLGAIATGVAVILILILYFRIQAFMALLIGSIVVGLLAGMPPLDIMDAIKNGMGGTLGFVAVVVGLGALFGAILEHSGGAEAVAGLLLKATHGKGVSWALMLTGFIIAIPVFFDVAFIILVPLVYSLQRKSKKSILLYGIPLLAGLAITHAFIPPTPGPVAVADILKADLGWVIVVGFIVGIPTAIVSGPLFGKYIAKQIYVEAPERIDEEETPDKGMLPHVLTILAIIALPIFLIVCNTLLNSPVAKNWTTVGFRDWMGMIGHPFTALILANLIAWYVLGIRRKTSKEALLKISTKSLAPAGVIILLTGAGGVFKQVLIETGAGNQLADAFAAMGLSTLVFAFVVAALVRILQGSATVAMITAAGVTAPLLVSGVSSLDKALLVIAIAAGASILSHVNDSGFWLVSKYLGLTEKQTFRSWTVMTTILALTGFASVWLLSLLL